MDRTKIAFRVFLSLCILSVSFAVSACNPASSLSENETQEIRQTEKSETIDAAETEGETEETETSEAGDVLPGSVSWGTLDEALKEYTGTLFLVRNVDGHGEITCLAYYSKKAVMTSQDQYADIIRYVTETITADFWEGGSVSANAYTKDVMSFYDCMIAYNRFWEVEESGGPNAWNPNDTVALRGMRDQDLFTCFIETDACAADLADTDAADRGLVALFELVYRDRGNTTQHFGMQSNE